MLVNQQFITDYEVCDETKALIEQNNLLNQEAQDVVRVLRDLGHAEPSVWWNNFKKTEAYVRANGSVFTMNAYQVFNPLTGQHTRYETEEEAKNALVEIAKQILSQHVPVVVQELANENGDTTWIPTTMHETLIVS